jgi:FMN phosphatase YigB (HAD superfamily)
MFDYVFEELKIFPNESIFIDDLQENCELANKVGIKTILMKNPKQVISDLSGILGIDL